METVQVPQGESQDSKLPEIAGDRDSNGDNDVSEDKSLLANDEEAADSSDGGNDERTPFNGATLESLANLPICFATTFFELLTYVLADAAVLEVLTSLPPDCSEEQIENWVATGAFLRYIHSNCCKPPVAPKKMIHIIMTMYNLVQEFRHVVYDKTPHRMEKTDYKRSIANHKFKYYNLTPANIFYMADRLMDELVDMKNAVERRNRGSEEDNLEEDCEVVCQAPSPVRLLKYDSDAKMIVETIHESMIGGWKNGNEDDTTVHEVIRYMIAHGLGRLQMEPFNENAS